MDLDLLHTNEIDRLLAEVTETAQQTKALVLLLQTLVPVLRDLLVNVNAAVVNVNTVTGRIAGR